MFCNDLTSYKVFIAAKDSDLERLEQVKVTSVNIDCNERGAGKDSSFVVTCGNDLYDRTLPVC